MKQVKQLTRQNIEGIMDSVNIAVEKALAEYGLTLNHRIKCSFDANGFSGKIDASVKTESGISKEVVEGLKMLGLEYGQELTQQGKKFKVVGFNRNARKNAVVIEEVATGKKYTASEEVVKKYSNKKVETVVNPVTPDFANNNNEVDAALKSGKVTLHIMDMLDAKGLEYGQVVTIKGSQYKVTGYNKNASKNPVIITAIKSGKEYNASLEMIKG